MQLGFVINPIAGMGGRVGLKGTDDVLKEAIARGAKPVAPIRARCFLQKLREDMEETPLEILTCPDVMGEEETRKAGFQVQVLDLEIGGETTAEDTKTAIRLMVKAKVDLVVFVGGDGTAKDVFDAVQGCGEVLVLGVPSGVKMYSGVFATNPPEAAHIVLAFAENQAKIMEFEIMDVDEQAIRRDTLAVKLYGFVKGPFVAEHIQRSKQTSPDTTDEKESQRLIARFITEEMDLDATYLLGPGTTVKRIAELSGSGKTLLGVDIYRKGNTLLDVNEKRILEEVSDWRNTWIIISPVGRQGMLFGRGNQQISSEVIKRVGKQRIIVAATESKLQSIEGPMLRVDTGDTEVDRMLGGYLKVVTGYREWRLMPVK